VRSRDGVHSGEESEKKVEQVRVVTRTQRTLASLEFIPGKRLEKVGEECGGGYKFKGRDEVLIFMSVATKVRLQLRGGEWATIGCLLELRFHAIMQREDWYTVCVKVGEEKFGETPRGSTIMKMLDDAK